MLNAILLNAEEMNIVCYTIHMRLKHKDKIFRLHEKFDSVSYSPSFESSEDYEVMNINHGHKKVFTKDLLLHVRGIENHIAF